MPPSRREKPESKRLNRVVGVGEAAGRLLDPALRRRGFATRDILAHWKAMAPAPYDAIAMPDRLAWPRGARGADGATLYLRCAPGHGLALVHEGPMVAAAINRYFGYLLVGEVRLSPTPFTRRSSPPPETAPELDAAERQRLCEAVSTVSDDGLREALASLGASILGKARARRGK